MPRQEVVKLVVGMWTVCAAGHSSGMSSDGFVRGIAGASAVVAITSFVWAVLSWRLNGPALRVHCLAYREVVVVRLFNAGRTAESVEHIVLGGRKGGADGLDLTAALGLPLRLEPGETKSWSLNPCAEPLASRWSNVSAGWESLWLLTGSMRQHRAEALPLLEERPPAVGWRLVPRRTKLARYAPLCVGLPVALFAGSADMSPLSRILVVLLALIVAVRAGWVMGSGGGSFLRRRVERWALATASLMAVVEASRASNRPDGELLSAADWAGLGTLLAVGMILAVPGWASHVAFAVREGGSWVRRMFTASNIASAVSVANRRVKTTLRAAVRR